MRIGWVLGWAVPAEWFVAEAARAWPGAEHACVPAAPDWMERMEALGALDRVGGYSLGALLLLGERERVSARWRRAGLIAPIWSFPREAGRGGVVGKARLRALARWMRREPEAARLDFYDQAGLGTVFGDVEDAATLEWGLERLGTLNARPGLPAGWFAAHGADDLLTDAVALSRAEGDVLIVPTAGHAPAPLIRAWAREEAGR